MGLFDPIPNPTTAIDRTRPLADRMRPRTLDEYAGQEQSVPANLSARKSSAMTPDLSSSGDRLEQAKPRWPRSSRT
jgi:hypothetical protein